MKKFTGIIWVFSPQFPIAFYFLKILQFLFISFYFIWQNIYVHLLGTVCCFDSYINQEMWSSG